MTVRAAGGVVWRTRGERLEVLLVHRPRYGDWSLPKGKREAGETDEQCAVREVFEECAVIGHLGDELWPSRYADPKGRDKVVRWWAMSVADERPFMPSAEIDELRWVAADDLAELATHRDDVALVEMALQRMVS